jgi:prepilin-type N-terminal cleavage/methylation domain-containing protein
MQKAPRTRASGFTLIELTIVLVVIGVIMSVTLRLSWSYLKDLDFKSIKDEFVSTFVLQISQVTSSNYHSNQKVTHFTQELSTGSRLTGSYRAQDGVIQTVPFKFVHGGINRIWQQGKSQEWIGNLMIRQEPYRLGCEVSFTGTKNEGVRLSTGSMFLLLSSPRTAKRYCLKLQLSTCKMQDIGCEGN